MLTINVAIMLIPATNPNSFSTGELVNATNAHEIVNAIKKIVSNYDSYSKNALEWSSKFHWNAIVEKYLMLFDETKW